MTRIDQPWLTAAETQHVCAALTSDGAQVFFVGGCVRNAVLEVPVSDLDIATDASPQHVLSLAKKAGIRPIPTGIDHGTVTLVHNGATFEVTTFRKDVTTDGRRAVVAFSSDIAEDAGRRDFTMNALYATPDGEIVDPLGGMSDLQARHVRFIGDPEARIREDYLRSLRYFRFHAWYGNSDNGLDAEAMAGIAANLDGLALLSKERIGAEFLKLMAAPDPAPAVAGMRQAGVLTAVLPGADDRSLAPLIHLEADAGPDNLSRLVVLGGTDVAERLRLSRKMATTLDILQREATEMKGAPELSFRFGPEVARRIILVRAALLEQSVSADLEAELKTGATARFPVSASDLMPDFQGAALGKALRELESSWIASGFNLGRDELLALLR